MGRGPRRYEMNRNLINRGGLALLSALSLAVISSPTLSQKADEKAPPKPKGAVNSPIVVNNGGGNLVYKLKICKGAKTTIPLSFNGKSSRGTFENPSVDKNIP